MTVKELEAINHAKLPKKYHNIVNQTEILSMYVKDIMGYWDNEETEKYFELNDYIFHNKRELYYILFIWLHPLTKFQQLANKVDKL